MKPQNKLPRQNREHHQHRHQVVQLLHHERMLPQRDRVSQPRPALIG
jgi:hypothetical protein